MLANVITTFNDRITEVNSYLDLVLNEEGPSATGLISVDNLATMKGAVVVMLYNAIEFAINSSFITMFDYIETNNIPYKKLTKQVGERWFHVEFLSCHDHFAGFDTYKKTASRILQVAINDGSIVLTRKSMGIQGNVNAKEIKDLCQRFGISLNTRRLKGECLELIKNTRNELAHGTYSFRESGANFTCHDLEVLIKEASSYINLVLKEIDKYAVRNGFLTV